jgi:hypothetical protein
MSQRLSLLGEHQRKMLTSMGLENPKPIVYPPLPPPPGEDPWAWYRNANDDDDEIQEESE